MGDLVDPNFERMVAVKGIPKSADWQEIKDFMNQAGQVQHAEVIYDEWGSSKGVAFVRYSKNEEAETAKTTLNGQKMQGKEEWDKSEVTITEWKGQPPENAQHRGNKKGKGKGKWGGKTGNPMADMWMSMMGFGGGGGWGGGGWGPYGGGKGGKGKGSALVEPHMIPIINRVKSFQKSGEENKQIWYKFCGDGDRDPALHPEHKLLEFLEQNGVP